MSKIIHIDMDCFYAAIEMRDNPALKNKPVAVGGESDRRGVLCTCNYLARQYGVRSAMPTAYAYRLCPDLIVVPVNMAKYRQVAQAIHEIFHEFTEQVEPLSLDEAFLDVSDTPHYHGSATWIANAIRQKIWQEEHLTASAGIAPNKLLAKIASGWKKPNGLFTITPDEIAAFMEELPVEQLWGVGRVTAEKLHRMNLTTCADLQKVSLLELITVFGKLGQHLYDQCRGIDHRTVKAMRTRKSLSVEETFAHDIAQLSQCIQPLTELYARLIRRLQTSTSTLAIKNQFVKIKLSDFTLKTAEIASHAIRFDLYWDLLEKLLINSEQPIRLLGIGVHFDSSTSHDIYAQQELEL
jgi:DNA polymerase-4